MNWTEADGRISTFLQSHASYPYFRESGTWGSWVIRLESWGRQLLLSSPKSPIRLRLATAVSEVKDWILQCAVGPIAQSVEQRTFNPWVDGSSPSGPTPLNFQSFYVLGLPVMYGHLVKKKPTVRDVAKEASVSIGTVSNVLNRPAQVNEETRLRVRNAIDILGLCLKKIFY